MNWRHGTPLFGKKILFFKYVALSQVYSLFDHSVCKLPTFLKSLWSKEMLLSGFSSSQVHPSDAQLLLRIRLLNLLARAESPSSSLSLLLNWSSFWSGVDMFLCPGQIL